MMHLSAENLDSQEETMPQTLSTYTFTIRPLLGGEDRVHTVTAACGTAAWLKALNDNEGPRGCRAILTEVK